MKLYHGTSERNVASILSQGLLPRRFNKNNNWHHTVSSHPDLIYLTECYGGYFANAACRNRERWALVEIDTDKLKESNFLPDEDFLAQAFELRSLSHYSIFKSTEKIRDELYKYSDYWEISVQGLGNCAYKGTIPIEAISRISLYNPTSNPVMTLLCLDPSISILNHTFCSQKYIALTKWLMGERITVDELYFEAELKVMRDVSPVQIEKMKGAINSQQVEILIPKGKS